MTMMHVRNGVLGIVLASSCLSIAWAAPEITTGPAKNFSSAAPDVKRAGQSAGKAVGKVAGVDVRDVQAKIMSNPAVMAEIQAIASDPEIIAIVADPAFLQAVQSKNLNEVQSNPRTAQFMANPKIRSLMEKIQALIGS